MARPVKWSRDLHLLRERATGARTETWSRVDIERLFGIGRASAQGLMKAIGEVQSVGGAHFVDRASLLQFLEEMIAAPTVEEALQARHREAAPVARPQPLRITLPEDLRRITARDLPASVQLQPGEIRIQGDSAENLVEGLLLLAQAMQNDLEEVRRRIEPASAAAVDDHLHDLLAGLRGQRAELVGDR